MGAPQVNYRESISRAADIKYTHKKQVHRQHLPCLSLHHPLLGTELAIQRERETL